MALRLNNVQAHLNGREILTGVNLDLGPGVTGLVGVNGAGKTTLMRVVAGVVLPSAGSVERQGIDIHTDSDSLRQHRQELGWLPQEPGLPPRMTVSDLVSYAAWLKRVDPVERGQKVSDALGHVDLIQIRDRRLGRMSGGQRRRAALAAALVGSPNLLLLDEPTNGLDPLQRDQFLNMVRVLAVEASVLVATHLLEDLALVADRWAALQEGKIVGSGTIDRSSSETLTKSIEELRSSIGLARDSRRL